jgi:hypothetical protein
MSAEPVSPSAAVTDGSDRGLLLAVLLMVLLGAVAMFVIN